MNKEYSEYEKVVHRATIIAYVQMMFPEYTIEGIRKEVESILWKFYNE